MFQDNGRSALVSEFNLFPEAAFPAPKVCVAFLFFLTCLKLCCFLFLHFFLIFKNSFYCYSFNGLVTSVTLIWLHFLFYSCQCV